MGERLRHGPIKRAILNLIILSLELRWIRSSSSRHRGPPLLQEFWCPRYRANSRMRFANNHASRSSRVEAGTSFRCQRLGREAQIIKGILVHNWYQCPGTIKFCTTSHIFHSVLPLLLCILPRSSHTQLSRNLDYILLTRRPIRMLIRQ